MKCNSMNIGLLLVGTKGEHVLRMLLKSKNVFNISFVASYKDRNTKDTCFDSIKSICEEKHIDFLNNTKSIRFPRVDKIFAIGWQFIIKDNLDNLVVIHDSKLPKYKGWSPTVNALIQGEKKIGATAFCPTDQMDTGDIYCQKEIAIEYPIKIEEALNLVSDLYVEIVLFICEKNPKPYEMEGEEDFCIWRDYLDYFVDWTESADKIKRFIDAVGFPYEGAKINLDNQVLTVRDCKIIKASIVEQEKHCGKVFKLISGEPVIICGKDLLHLSNIFDEQGEPYKFKKLKIRL